MTQRPRLRPGPVRAGRLPRRLETCAIAGLLAACLALAGCANRSMHEERTLAAAGFQMKFADTPEKLEHLKELGPQRKLSSHIRDHQLLYAYPDARYCKCLYVGSEAAYQRYQQLAILDKTHEPARSDAPVNPYAGINWGLWGGWGPWW